MKWILLLLAAGAATLGFVSLERWKELSRHPFLVQSIEKLRRDPGIRAEVIAQLAASSGGVFDSHPDRDVVRILQPNLDGEAYLHQPLSTNRWGMREVDYELPKPEDVRRIVFLGDSFVFGNGVRREDRVGTFLQAYVDEKKAAGTPRVEVLSIGIGSWDVVSEAEYVRRHVELLQPDLVLHITVSNDLDDTHGTRGWGSLADMAPRMPAHCNGRVNVRHPTNYGFSVGNHLCFPLGWEARHRYEELATYASRLAEEVERQGGRYVFALYWSRFNVHLPPFLAGKFRPDQLAFIPHEIQENRAYWIDESDPHWGRAGGERIAQLFYGLILNRNLLEEIDLEEWPEVQASTRKALADGLAYAQRPFPYERLKESLPLRGRVEFQSERPSKGEREKLDRLRADLMQVYAGVDDVGRVSPYASLLLAPERCETLRLRGSCFDRPEIDGGRVDVFVEEHLVHTFELAAGEKLDLDLPLPPGLAERIYLNVRFRATDWIYGGPSYRKCFSFRIDSVEID